MTEGRGAAKLRCPICSAVVEKPSSSTPPKKSYFPFCSDRCRMVDLGRWLTGQYVIPGDTVNEEELPPAAQVEPEPNED